MKWVDKITASGNVELRGYVSYFPSNSISGFVRIHIYDDDTGKARKYTVKTLYKNRVNAVGISYFDDCIEFRTWDKIDRLLSGCIDIESREKVASCGSVLYMVSYLTGDYNVSIYNITEQIDTIMKYIRQDIVRSNFKLSEDNTFDLYFLQSRKNDMIERLRFKVVDIKTFRTLVAKLKMLGG